MNSLASIIYGTAIRPCHGHRAGGDAVAVETVEDTLIFSHIDVLGHGLEANELAQLLVQAASRQLSVDPLERLESLHQQFLGHRGAAAAVVCIDQTNSQVNYAGIGNITTHIIGTTMTNFISTDGVLGQRWRSPKLQTASFNRRDILFTHSDGLPSHLVTGPDETAAWHLQQPTTLARRLVASHGKDHDDASVLIARYSHDTAPPAGEEP